MVHYVTKLAMILNARWQSAHQNFNKYDLSIIIIIIITFIISITFVSSQASSSITSYVHYIHI